MYRFLCIVTILALVGAATPTITPTVVSPTPTTTDTLPTLTVVSSTLTTTVTLPTPTLSTTASDEPSCESIDPTWFERECVLHVQNATLSYCVGKLYGSGSEGKSSVALGEEDHAKAPHNLLVLFATFAIGALVRFLCMDTGIPFTVVMFLIGTGFGAIGKVSGEDSVWYDYMGLADMNPHLILYSFLPVLIFESAFAMEIPVFKKVVVQCILLAGPGLLVASFVTGMVAKVAFTKYEWTTEACLLFGTILSATDPVAVVALLKELGASKLISTMIEGESLFNDGTAIVIFNVLIGAVERSSCDVEWDSCTDQCHCPEFDCELKDSALSILWNFVKVSLGGPLVGLLIAFVTVKSLERVFNDTLIEITLTLTSAYITFFVCEGFFEVSGVLGLVALGCYLSYFRNCISPEVEHTLHEFWEMAVFLTNSCIFSLAGMIVALKAFNNLEATDALYLLITYVTINIVRMGVLLLFSPILYQFKYKLTKGTMCLVAWGGLRGAVGLSLALVLQNNEEVVQPNVRDKVIFHTAGIVLLTLIVNGTTTQGLVTYFGLNAVELRKRRIMHDRFAELKNWCTYDIVELRKEPLNYDCNWANVDALTDLEGNLAEGNVDPYNQKATLHELDDVSHAEAVEAGRIAYLTAAASSVHSQYAAGSISAVSARRLSELIQAASELDPATLSADNPGFLLSSAIDTLLIAPRFSYGNSWIKSSFEIAMGFIMLHRYTQAKIPLLAEKSVAKPIVSHSKKVSNEVVTKLSDMIDLDPSLASYARSVRTRHASRDALNHMRGILGTLQREGRVDAADKEILTYGIVQQMKKIEKRFPDTMDLPASLKALEMTSWYPELDPAAREAVDALAEKPGALRNWGRNLKDSFLRLMGKELGLPQKPWACPGLFVIVTGVVQIRLGRRLFQYGAGYTVGLQSLLTAPHKGSQRFSEAFAETECTMLYLHADDMQPLLKQHVSLSTELWKAAGVAATRMLMAADQTYNLWEKNKIKKVANGGYVEYVLDPTRGDAWEKEKRWLLPENSIAVLLKGRVWEYQDYDLVRFPVLLPPGLKYGTFSQHAVLFIVDESVWGSTQTRALQRWGRLKSKIRSIALWSGLRGEDYARTSLSKAFGRSPPVTPAFAPETPLPPLPLAVEPKRKPSITLDGKQKPVEKENVSCSSSGGSSTPWKETWNEEYKRPYFWNKETGVRCWKEPQELKDFKASKGLPPSSRGKPGKTAPVVPRAAAQAPEISEKPVTKSEIKSIIREELIRHATPPRGRGSGRGYDMRNPYAATAANPLHADTYADLGSARGLHYSKH